MIVFWRLLLAYYLCTVLFYNRRFFTWRGSNPIQAYVLQGLIFGAMAALLCAPYLQMDWRLTENWLLPGWGAVVILTGAYVIISRLLVRRAEQTKGYTGIFVMHEVAMWAAVLACSPSLTLYYTGNWMAEPMTVSCVGLLIVTKVFSIFIYRMEQDLYGREFPTVDESFVTMLMRLIFFLIALLPGWRWLVWMIIWGWACLVARKNRLMDLSNFAFYFSVFGTMAIGFVVRYSWYW